MVLADFLQFGALLAIWLVLLRLGQAKFANTEIGKVLAFFG